MAERKSAKKDLDKGLQEAPPEDAVSAVRPEKGPQRDVAAKSPQEVARQNRRPIRAAQKGQEDHQNVRSQGVKRSRPRTPKTATKTAQRRLRARSGCGMTSRSGERVRRRLEKQRPRRDPCRIDEVRGSAHPTLPPEEFRERLPRLAGSQPSGSSPRLAFRNGRTISLVSWRL